MGVLFVLFLFVLKLDNLELRKKLGWESQNPAWAIAWKFPSDSAITTVKGVDFRVGRTGQITPVLQLEPIAIGGETVRQVSLGSIKNLSEKDIAIGDQISVQLKGAATPVFGQVVLRPEHRTRPMFPDPKRYNAFSCLELKPGCEEQFTERLKWLGISLDIPFLHEPLIKKLMANKAIDRFPDSFKVSESDLKQAGLNEHSSKQLLSVLNTLHRVSLKSQIRALSIPQLGETRSRKLASHFKSWDKILDATPEEMAAVVLMSVKQAQRAKSYLNTPSIRDSIEWFRQP